MKILKIALHGAAKTGQISGRSSRSELWCFRLFIAFLFLFYMLLVSMLSQLGGAYSEITESLKLAFCLWGIFLAVSDTCLLIRRLHDVNRSGWWILLVCVPYVGPIILIYWMCKRSDEGDNRFGPQPLPLSC